MMGWQHLDFPGVLEAFARLRFRDGKHYDNLLDDRRKKSIHQQLRQDHSRRQQLLPMIIHNECGSEQDATTIVDSVSLIAFREDVMWMLDQLAMSGIGIEKSIWCQLVSRSFDRTDGRQVDAVLTACDREKCLSEELDWLINPVELDLNAETMKADYQRWQKWNKEGHDRPLLDPPLATRIERLLDQFESGDYNALVAP